jgi:hypothetical protein
MTMVMRSGSTAAAFLPVFCLAGWAVPDHYLYLPR